MSAVPIDESMLELADAIQHRLSIQYSSTEYEYLKPSPSDVSADSHQILPHRSTDAPLSAAINPLQLTLIEKYVDVMPSSLKTLCNTARPINALPLEILAHIFSMLAGPLSSGLAPTPAFPPSLDTHPLPSDLLQASHVCRLWRAVALAFPALWATLDTAQPRFVAPRLARARAAPLRVVLRDRTSHARTVPTLDDPHLRALVAEEGARIEQLHIEPRFSYGPALLAAFRHPARVLRALTVRNANAPGECELPQMFAGCTPRLERLVVSGFTSWPGNTFANLRRVCLDDQVESSRPSLSSFLEFLALSPRLEELILVNAGPTDNASSVGLAFREGRALVSLPALRALELGEWPNTRNIGQLLSCLSLPATTTINIWAASLAQHQQLEALLPKDTTHLGPLRGLHKMTLMPRTAADTKEVLSVRDGALHLLGDICAASVLPVLFDRLDVRALRALAVAQGPRHAHGLSQRMWRALLPRAPRLASLATPSDSSAALIALYREDEDTGGDAREGPALCPALSALSVTDDRECTALLLILLAGRRAELGRPIARVRVDGPPDAMDGFVRQALRESVAVVEYKQGEPALEREQLAHWPSEAYCWAESRQRL
ncbi:hypothetical protein WOLCODRAFT_163373 [Wolfiporia cocos MD-104 SS10]|uniref:F-box domain-containing protein n=1 Tax=Wolfiporia cocos (strain MD-104) TaxID=742152 RepID=A0A2H3JYG7_WOLCO|nr:hypothetical protein WOLCODRAFT_163373 [Wolfiporia cocos MD-104 SS10]